MSILTKNFVSGLGVWLLSPSRSFNIRLKSLRVLAPFLVQSRCLQGHGQSGIGIFARDSPVSA